MSAQDEPGLAIQARGLTKRFGDLVAVDHVDLSIPEARVHGFLGPNGSGKSTTIRMLCGLLTPTAGDIEVLGLQVPREAEALRQRVGYMETCYACAATPGVDFRTLRLNTDAYSAEIAAASKDFGVEESIVRAIIHAESAFNPNALSRVGAQGLMQLMPATARRFGVGNPFDAAQNIRGGVQYLAFLLKRFNGDLSLAAAGYNAGEGAVDKYRGVPPYNETQRYVQRVGLLAQRYRGGFATR